MKEKWGKRANTIIFVFGCFLIFLALIYTEWSTQQRFEYAGTGVLICLVAKVTVIRWILISLLALLVGVSSLYVELHDLKRIDLLWFCVTSLSFALAAYYGWKIARKYRPLFKLHRRPPRRKEQSDRGSVNTAPTESSTTTQPPPSPEVKVHTLQDTIDEATWATTPDELIAFERDHPLLDEVRTKVVGISFDNDDGSSRQENVSKCKPGDCVMFHPYQYQGEPALAVYTEHGQIGHLSADLAKQFDEYTENLILSGTITEITGGTNGAYYGCNLHIKVFKD